LTALPLQRVTFEMSREREYLDLEELQTMTGQGVGQFPAVILKELGDNGLDAAEAARVPPVIGFDVQHADGLTRICVSDNGSGISTEMVTRITNFSTRTSDKSAYRSPTRGQLGNAFKTILGMPFAFGVNEPVTVEACGVRHTIRAGLDPAGELRLDHVREEIGSAQAGTVIGLTLPQTAFDSVDAARWAMKFALFNPHAEVRFSENGGASYQGNGSGCVPAKSPISYQPTVEFPGGWRKFLPSDNTSPWWYDRDALAKLVFAHIANARRKGAETPLLLDFVQEFRGLTRRGQAKAVCERLPGVHRLGDFEGHEGKVAELLEAMKDVADKQPKPAFLGWVGKEHFEQCFAAWGGGCHRSWYRRVEEIHEGLPYIVEVAVAEVARSCGGPFFGVNFSPTFGDPLAGTSIFCPKFCSYGFVGFLDRAHARPGGDEAVTTTAALHIVCPHLSVSDKGKTKMNLPRAVVDFIGEALWRVTKDLYREGERRRRDAAKQERADQERRRERRGDELPLSQAVELVLPEAIRSATGNGALPVSAHTLFYHVRPLVQKYNATRQLKPKYFEQKLLPAYQQAHGVIPGLYYEPRGTLYEPHTGRAVALGTREVSDYLFPSWLYDKILYVEKQGLWPVFRQARLAERLDMAIVAGEGYATEACRVLFQGADKGRKYQLFVLHDCDPYGFNIARTLREETVRMPGYSVEVIDIGLKLADALSLGLETETFTRKKALPQELELTDQEWEYFTGHRGAAGWVARRIELNALSGPALVRYAEAGLRAAGCRGKVIPDKDNLPGLSRGLFRGVAGEVVKSLLDELLGRETLVSEIADELTAGAKLGGALRTIRQALRRDDCLSWNAALWQHYQKVLRGRKGLGDVVRERVVERLNVCCGISSPGPPGPSA
jgi:hypothetical protein